jgi:hypothetical protein
VPSFTIPSTDLQRLGPTLSIRIGVVAELEATLRAAGGSPPPPLSITAIVDTGAHRTVIQQNLAVQLGLQPISLTSVNTASSAYVLCPEYDVRLLFPRDVVRELPVLEAPLPGQNVQCLIGRDILSRAVLVYLGETNLFSLSF